MGTHRYSLLESGDLVIEVADALRDAVEPWLPLQADVAGAGMPALATIRVRFDSILPDQRTPERIVLQLGTVTLVETAPSVFAMHGRGGISGRIMLDGLASDVVVRAPLTDDAAADAYSMLTLSAAFLLGRSGSVLMHAGAVVDPAGRAWLLVGDSHSGKTTTCASLIDVGWCYLADDQVVLRRGANGAIDVEGWPRIAHLDEGWDDREVRNARVAVDLRERWGDQLRRSATLGGVLLPAVHRTAPTMATAAHPAEVFAALVRQSPWLMADGMGAPVIASLLGDIAGHPSYQLSLGEDSYASGTVLSAALVTAWTA
ncbi:MAG: hypothetical protein JWM95_2809 [Gemmatimonadetes bacterium]|nr:hypothetical protein [Gemmatimonadota bacterium]